MPTTAITTSKARIRPKARLRRIEGTPVLIRPTDLQARVAEIIQRLQDFHRSLGIAASTYTPKRLQMLSKRLAAVYDQSKHLPKYQKATHAKDHPSKLESGRLPAKCSPLPVASPARASRRRRVDRRHADRHADMSRGLKSLAAALVSVPAVAFRGRLARVVALDGLERINPHDWLYSTGRPYRYNLAGSDCVYFSEIREVAQMEYDS